MLKLMLMIAKVDWCILTPVVAASIFLLCGCSSNPKYVEGVNTAIGAYIPYQSNLYGIEVLNYLSGCKAQCMTNQNMSIDRQYSATNSYFGIVHTVESSHTKINITK